MKTVFTIIALLSMMAHKMQQIGIIFENSDSWKILSKKASAERKLLFVDINSPSSPMNAVQGNDSLGNYINRHFISVRLSLDSLEKSFGRYRQWNKLIQKSIAFKQPGQYPKYLFFSPEGNLLHWETGDLTTESLLVVARNAASQVGQYYRLLTQYREGSKIYDKIPNLIRAETMIGDTSLSNLLRKDYVSNFLLKMDDSLLFTKHNLFLLQELVNSPEGPGFGFFEKHLAKIDSIMGGKFSERVIINIIHSAVTAPYLNSSISENEWNSIHSQLLEKYGKLGEFDYIESRVGYAWSTNDWDNYGRFFKLYYEHGDSLNVYFLNNVCWSIFVHSQDRTVLQVAVNVMGRHKEENIHYMDTYANLLYKLGKTTEAIDWEQRAAKTEKEDAETQNRAVDSQYLTTVEKMKEGQATW